MELSRGQAWILGSAAVPMVAFGALGGFGTYANIISEFDRSATALGVIAAGEGATLILALVMVGLTMLGQPSPQAVRIGLWALPVVASTVGAIVAETLVESVVFAVTPMAMCVAAEGLGLLARRVVVYRTGVDMEVQRRNAETMQKLAYHSARAANHHRVGARKRSAHRAWRLARKVGVGDMDLGLSLIGVQRDRMTSGADTALRTMLSGQDEPTDTRTPGQPDRTSPRTPGHDPVRPGHLRPDGQDKSEDIRTDTILSTPDSPVRTDKQTDTPSGQTPLDLAQRQNVSAFVRGLLAESPDISDADIRTRIREDFGADTEPDRIRKAIKRARARVA